MVQATGSAGGTTTHFSACVGVFEVAVHAVTKINMAHIKVIFLNVLLTIKPAPGYAQPNNGGQYQAKHDGRGGLVLGPARELMILVADAVNCVLNGAVEQYCNDQQEQGEY